MKTIFLKIIALFFLTILLTSNILNLHVYLHEQEDNQELRDTCQNEDDDQHDSCDLCLLALQLNNLDFNNTLEFSYENLTQVINYEKVDVVTYKTPYYDQRFSHHHRNKAPPTLI